jgi:hypothetical protein
MVERFVPSHLPMIQSWYVGHGWEPIPEDEIPPLGWVTDCCAMWAFRTETSIALIENLISDPAAHPRRVLRSMRELAPVVLSELRALGIKKTLTYTFSPLCARFFSAVPGAERHRKPFTMYRVPV